MRKLGKVEWFLFVVSMLLGGLAGAVLGFVGTFAFFQVTGTGKSHNDMFNLLEMIVYGAIAGSIARPAYFWRRWRRRSPL